MEEQVVRREMDDFETHDVQPCRMCLGDREIYYMNHNSEFWEAVSHKKLDDAGVKKY